MERLQRNTAQPKRDGFVDIVKGIGIISIVIGHAVESVSMLGISFRIKDFVYTYHIMIFMFVLGFLFCGRGENEQLIKRIGKTAWSNWKLYVIYMVLFILLHNLFYCCGLIGGGEYDVKQTGIRIWTAVRFLGQEQLLSPFWFVPMYLFSALLFYCLFHIAQKTSKPLPFHIAFACLTMAMGFVLNGMEIELIYKMQVSFLAVPICYCGYFCKKYFSVVRKSLKWYGALVAAAVIYLLLALKVGIIELYLGELMRGWLFYPVTLMGIYYCLSLAATINKVKYVKGIFAYIGKNSFHIMALHCTAFKVLDVCAGRLLAKSAEVYVVFPIAFDFWYLYYPVGVFLPLLLPLAIAYVKKLMKRKGEDEKKSVTER